jgi:very-short-patch-repair endonuclease
MAVMLHLQGTEHMNPQVAWSDGRAFYQGRPLTVSQEQLQLYFKAGGCKGGRTHFRLLTPYTVHKGADMTCCFCQDRSKYETERAVGKALIAAGLDTSTTWQCVPPGAGSVVDFYVYTSQLVIQADGTAHTQGVRPDRAPRQLLQHDIRRCVAAWQSGLKLMRIHYKDLADCLLPWVMQQVVATATNAHGPFVVLSPGYWDIVFQHPATGVHVGYAQYLSESIASPVTLNTLVNGWRLLC